ncbi:MAG: rod shape-determining protein [Clostridia bacterium]|nr:rod shape-determining protein [Clostridia bacterium]
MAIVAPDIGIDLGTSNTVVCVRKKGIVLSEPTVLVVENGGKHAVRAIGAEAYDLMGRTTNQFTDVHPMADGVIRDYEMALALIQFFIRKAIGVSHLVKPRAVITIPGRMTPIERRVIRQAALNAGVRKNGLNLVEKSFAAALGSGLPVSEPIGNMVVDVGGGTTEVAVISVNGIVISRSVRIGGVKMNEAITAYIKKDFNMLITDRIAEEVKMDLGAALPLKEERHATVRGKDMITDLPQIAEISTSKIYEALRPICEAILAAIQFVLSKTPPELCGDIIKNGIHLTGGGAMLFGLDQYIASGLGIKVLLAKDPLTCSAMGVSQLADNYELLHRLAGNTFQQSETEE